MTALNLMNLAIGTATVLAVVAGVVVVLVDRAERER